MSQAIIFSAPSGSGKSTLIQAIIQTIPTLSFSISATSRAPRGTEQHGVEYYFLSTEEFRSRIDQHEFLEYEEVYKGCYYGTLLNEVKRLTTAGKVVIFDIDVIGGINLKKHFGDNALSLFIQPPSIEELERRLHQRATDDDATIARRLEKAAYEMTFSPQFDQIIVNDDLTSAINQTTNLIRQFIEKQT